MNMRTVTRLIAMICVVPSLSFAGPLFSPIAAEQSLASVYDSSTPPPIFEANALPIDPVSGFPNSVITPRYVLVGLRLVIVTRGTTAYSRTISVDGVTRRYVIVRPDPAPAGNAPLLILFHPSNTPPETMANLTQVANYVLIQNYWAAFPEAVNGQWKDDPTTQDDSDVRFTSALIDSLATQGIDDNRVYAAGYSSGGFMTERLACELSDKIAAFGIAAATMKGVLRTGCTPVAQRRKAYFLGTSDTLVPYEGIYSGTPAGLDSAEDSLSFWATQQQCGGAVSTPIPNRDPLDGTTVQKDERTGCAGDTALQLYTVFDGGHTWPGGVGQIFDTTTQDIHATGLISLFVDGVHR